jgi:hypothetical protein
VALGSLEHVQKGMWVIRWLSSQRLLSSGDLFDM